MMRTVSKFDFCFFDEPPPPPTTTTTTTAIADKCNYAKQMCAELSTNITVYAFMQFEISMIIIKL